jgi:hypothetical protein
VLLKTENRQKQLETKHDENTIYRPRVIRGLYRRKLNIKTKSQEETEMETSSEADTPQGGMASRWPVPPSGVEPPSSISNSFLSRDFSYLVKIAKVLKTKFNANFF